ncbi:hypothetical protein GTW51_13290 [Aurantimonas aggregata]|uniref:Uncharacterized protein n=1 Tax=Aurantimonas aggregata TaxID=2047720 RepID=A0A6L9MJ42_9HYPH|nr:DUF6220 domain-containing protein [Aurantimonas aggregata]NDV87676.1 hypothetical protein [Aurantimonas aggregata]
MPTVTHDTFRHLDLGTPVFFTLTARILPGLLAIRFLLVAQPLSGGLLGDIHALIGDLVGFQVLVIAGYAFFMSRLRGFGWWACVIVLTYLAQFALAASGPVALVFHTFNAALLLSASLVLLFKVERRRAREVGHGRDIDP